MKRKQAPEKAGFKCNGGFGAEYFLGDIAEQGKLGGIGAPFDQFQAAVVFRQVEKMPVIPGLQVTFIHAAKVNGSPECAMQVAKIGNGYHHIGFRNLSEGAEDRLGIVHMFEHMTQDDIIKFLTGLIFFKQ